MQSAHGDTQYDQKLIAAMVDAASVPVQDVAPSTCCFCDAWDARLRLERSQRHGTPLAEPITVPLRKLLQHLSRHMEQLALFAIGPTVGEDELDDRASLLPQQPELDTSHGSSGGQRITWSSDADPQDLLHELDPSTGMAETQAYNHSEEQQSNAYGAIAPDTITDGLVEAKGIRKTQEDDNNSAEVTPSCAICGAPPFPECLHEGERLELALTQALERRELGVPLPEDELQMIRYVPTLCDEVSVAC